MPILLMHTDQFVYYLRIDTNTLPLMKDVTERSLIGRAGHVAMAEEIE